MAGVRGGVEDALLVSTKLATDPVDSKKNGDVHKLDLGQRNKGKQTEGKEEECVAGEHVVNSIETTPSPPSPGQHDARQDLGLRGSVPGCGCVSWAREESMGKKRVSWGVGSSPRDVSDKREGGAC